MDAPRLHLVASRSALRSETESVDRETNSSEQIRAELRRVLSSAHFDASERNRRFFEYVVEETLAGRSERIKAYNIATIVFGRDESFDPIIDPVVRMEARRLRRSLERFYLVEGRAGPVHITLPKGGYVPKFQRLAELLLAADFGLRGEVGLEAVHRPAILISMFGSELGCPNDIGYSEGFARQIVVGLCRSPNLTIFMPIRENRSLLNGERAGIVPKVDFVLGGNLVVASDRLKVKATLLLADTGQVVWADTLESDLEIGSLVDASDCMADRIVRTLREYLTVVDC